MMHSKRYLALIATLVGFAARTADCGAADAGISINGHVTGAGLLSRYAGTQPLQQKYESVNPSARFSQEAMPNAIVRNPLSEKVKPQPNTPKLSSRETSGSPASTCVHTPAAGVQPVPQLQPVCTPEHSPFLESIHDPTESAVDGTCSEALAHHGNLNQRSSTEKSTPLLRSEPVAVVRGLSNRVPTPYAHSTETEPIGLPNVSLLRRDARLAPPVCVLTDPASVLKDVDLSASRPIPDPTTPACDNEADRDNDGGESPTHRRRMHSNSSLQLPESAVGPGSADPDWMRDGYASPMHTRGKHSCSPSAHVQPPMEPSLFSQTLPAISPMPATIAGLTKRDAALAKEMSARAEAMELAILDDDALPLPLAEQVCAFIEAERDGGSRPEAPDTIAEAHAQKLLWIVLERGKFNGDLDTQTRDFLCSAITASPDEISRPPASCKARRYSCIDMVALWEKLQADALQHSPLRNTPLEDNQPLYLRLQKFFRGFAESPLVLSNVRRSFAEYLPTFVCHYEARPDEVVFGLLLLAQLSPGDFLQALAEIALSSRSVDVALVSPFARYAENLLLFPNQQAAALANALAAGTSSDGRSALCYAIAAAFLY